jgi:hypothetical protein
MTDRVARLNSALEGRYSVEAELGAGGMATVYLAEDLRHHRQVAIKVLKPELAAVLGAERFVQEITTTAQLQHPHILPLFDSGTAEGFLFYVMPYIEGETLREKLDRETQLGVEEAVRITREVADALDYAHRHGVIHRDIKPENILLHDGRPMVADFGIALAVSAAAGGRMTETGMSLGTPHYMSPEQATADKDLTGRSDVYSLASVLYEMLTGDPPHVGSSAQQIIVKIIADEARPVGEVRKSVPPNVAAAVGKALEKLPADRFESAKDFADALANPAFRPAVRNGPGAVDASRIGRAGWRARLRDPLVFVPSLVAVGAVAVAAWSMRRAPAVPETLPPIRFVLSTTDSAAPVNLRGPWPAAISPDGGTVVYMGVGPENHLQLYQLPTDGLEAHPIPGTAGGAEPYFSPDGNWVGFEQDGKERKVRLDGGDPVTITEGVTQNGAAWTAGDRIVLGAPGTAGGLSVVSAGGGTPGELTRVDTAKGERAHLWPIATPDPGTVVMTIWYGALESAKLGAASLDGGRVTPLGVSGIRPLAVLEGHLVYLRADGTVMAVPLDLRHKHVTGPPVPVHDRVSVEPGSNGNSDIFVSRGGGLVTGRGGSLGRLAWVFRDGTARPVLPDLRDFRNLSLSPDGTRIAVVVTDNRGSDVWIYDPALSTLSRLTTMGTVSSVDWTHDGSNVIFVAADSAFETTVWSQRSAGGSPPRKLFGEPDFSASAVLSPDARSLLLNVYHHSWDIERVPLDSTPVARPYLASEFDEQMARFSPDGKWVAYMSNETGQPEVYVRSFPDPTTKVQVSSGVGVLPHWSRDGSRLYYLTTPGHVSAVSVRIRLSPTFGLLERDTVSTGPISPFSDYDVSPDGTRVLAVAPASNAFQLVVSPNWIVELRRRLGVGGTG